MPAHLLTCLHCAVVPAWAVDYPTSTMQEFQVLTGLAKNLVAK